MTKLTQALLTGVVGLVVIAAAGPTIIKIIQVATPLVCVVGFVIIALKLVSWYTR